MLPQLDRTLDAFIYFKEIAVSAMRRREKQEVGEVIADIMINIGCLFIPRRNARKLNVRRLRMRHQCERVLFRILIPIIWFFTNDEDK
jgi:hypothetical protein